MHVDKERETYTSKTPALPSSAFHTTSQYLHFNFKMSELQDMIYAFLFIYSSPNSII